MVSNIYDRHLDMISMKDQEQINQTSVAIIGLGGVGGSAAMLCAKAGYGKLRLCDFDSYEESNIVEQEFAHLGNLSTPKNEVVSQQLINHSRHCQIESINLEIKTVDEAKEFIGDADVVISAVDNAKAKILIDIASQDLGKPLFTASNIGWTVLYTSFMPDGWRFTDIYKDLPGLEQLQPLALKFVELHHTVYFAVVGSFKVDYFRRLITGQDDHLRYMATHAYIAAGFVVNEVNKYVTGRAPFVKAPDSVALDMLHNQQINLNDYVSKIMEITLLVMQDSIDEACERFQRD
ncbi:MAG: ThiF family adenylyltransferase [Candidatus Cloacimonetes bacterium]|nr:ThiF family adenylyltransferase [Candidatus Cloacimonadota bacterium]